MMEKAPRLITASGTWSRVSKKKQRSISNLRGELSLTQLGELCAYIDLAFK